MYLLSFISVVFLLVGCFSVRVPLIRTGFRRLGWWIVASIVLLFIPALFAVTHWPMFFDIKTIISAIPFIPLALVCYRVWKGGPPG